MEETKSNIVKLFSKSQITSGVHQKNSFLVYNILKESDDGIELMKKAINVIVTSEKSVYVDRLVKFFGAIFETLKLKEIYKNNNNLEESGCPVTTEILNYLMKLSEVRYDRVRLTSCTLIHEILNVLTNVEIAVEICEDLTDYLLDRLSDQKINITLKAIESLARLQNHEDPDDRIIAYFRTLLCAPSAKIRQTVIENIAIRKDVMKDFVRSTRDREPGVRLAALKRLQKLAQYLKPEDRRDILVFAFYDNGQPIKQYLPTLIKSWVECYEDDIVKFMKSLQCGAEDKINDSVTRLYEKVLQIFLKKRMVSQVCENWNVDDKVIPLDELDIEIVCYWRMNVEYLHSQGECYEEELEKIVPELPRFSKYIVGFCDKMKESPSSEQQYILRQLFLMTRTFNYVDVFNRNCLNQLVQHVLRNMTLDTDTITVVVASLEASIPIAAQRTQFVSELISEIISPAEEAEQVHEVNDLQLAQLSVKISCLKNDVEEAVERKDFQMADNLHKELKEKEMELDNLKKQRYEQQETVQRKSDEPTLIKCLDIAIAAASSKQINKLTPALRTLMDYLVPEIIEHDNWKIRIKAFKFYALCCLMDKTLVSTGMQIFTSIMYTYSHEEKYEKEMLQLCLYAVCDLLLVYGTNLIASSTKVDLSESSDEDHQRVFAVSSITEIANCFIDIIKDKENEQEVKEWSYHALCRLLTNQIIMNSELISLLIVKWGAVNTGSMLRDAIGHTLETIAQRPECYIQLKNATISTIDRLLRTDESDDLLEAILEDVIKFVIVLCKISPKHLELEAHLSIEICKQICRIEDSGRQMILSKLLLSLEVPTDQSFLRELMDLCDEIKDYATNSKVRTNVTRFLTVLNEKYESSGTTEEMSGEVVEDTEFEEDENEDDNNIVTNSDNEE